MPLTLRVLFYSFRSAMLGLMIMLVGWISLTAASPQERIALRATANEARPDGLVPMRIARAFVHFAPNRAAKMMSATSDGRISVDQADTILRNLALGPASQDQPTEIAAPEQPVAPPKRGTSGAKFITVDKN